MATVALQHVRYMYSNSTRKMNKQIISPKGSILSDEKYEEIPKLANDGKQIWQVFFLPVDVNGSCPTIVAFCPFTKVFGMGCDVLEASKTWCSNAKKRFGKSFSIPKYLFTSRKVWYGVNRRQQLLDDPLDIATSSESLSGSGDQNVGDLTSEIPIFILDFNFIEDAVAVSPKTLKYVEGSINEWKSNYSTQNLLQFLPSFWMEWRVQCTPIMEVTSFPSNATRERETLTPNYIN